MLEKNRVIPHGCDSHSLIMARWPPYHTLTTPINNTILLQTAARSWLEKHLLCAPLLLCCHVSMLCPRLQSQGAIWGDWLKQSWETRTLNHKSLGNTRVRHFSALLPARKLLLMSFTTKTCISPSVDLIPSLPFLLPAIYSHQMTPWLAGERRAGCEKQMSHCMLRAGCRPVLTASAQWELGALFYMLPARSLPIYLLKSVFYGKHQSPS